MVQLAQAAGEQQSEVSRDTPIRLPARPGPTPKFSALDSSGCLRRESVEFIADAKAQSGGVLQGGEGWTSIHVSGTSDSGQYIKPDGYIQHGTAHGKAQYAPKVYFQTPEQLAAVLGMNPVAGSTTKFTRPGFSGEYQLQREWDGSLSVHYPGGRHTSSNRPIPAQTFHHGVWDLDRKTSQGAVTEARIAQREKNVAEASRVATTVASATDKTGTNTTAAGSDTTAAGTGFYSKTGALTRHGKSRADEQWATDPALAVGDLEIAVPTGSSSEQILARREAAPPVRVETQGSSGQPEVVYGFTRNVGSDSGILCISEREPKLPPEVLAAYRAASNPNGVLDSHIWLRAASADAKSPGLKSMVRSDGSVLVERDGGKLDLFVPDLRNMTGPGLTWQKRDMRAGDSSKGEADYVEITASKDKREGKVAPPVVTAQPTTPDGRIIRDGAEKLAKKHKQQGMFEASDFTVPDNVDERNKLVVPFATDVSGSGSFYIFPRRFSVQDASTKTKKTVSGILSIDTDSVAAIPDSGVRLAAQSAYGQLKTGGRIETWVDISGTGFFGSNFMGTSAQVNLRSDGSFVWVERKGAPVGWIVSPQVEGSKITWSKIPAVQDVSGRFVKK